MQALLYAIYYTRPPLVAHKQNTYKANECRYPEGDLDTNLTIVITNVGADFTRLGSFGDAEQFGGNVVAQMDRSYLNRSWNKPKSPVQVPSGLPH